MKKFATFVEMNCITKEPYIPCGTDCYLPLDGRLSLDNLKNACEIQLDKLKGLKTFVGYQIRIGSIKNNRVIYNSSPEYKSIQW